MNLRPSGYEPDELPDCSTPRALVDEELRSCQVDSRERIDLGLAGLAAPYSSAA